jgi:hypothetical protein
LLSYLKLHPQRTLKVKKFQDDYEDSESEDNEPGKDQPEESDPERGSIFDSENEPEDQDDQGDEVPLHNRPVRPNRPIGVPFNFK